MRLPALRLATVIWIFAIAGMDRPALSQSAATVTPVANTPAAASYEKEPYVFDFIEKKIRFEANGTGQRETTFRARIQSESAVREFGLLVYPFASGFESLEVDYVRVRKPDGGIIETPATDVQEIDTAVSRAAPMYTDEREKHIAVKALAVGDILDVRLHWTIQEPMAPGHFWYDQNFIHNAVCLRETLTIDVPRDIVVRFRSPMLQPETRELAGRVVYSFQRSNLQKQPEPKIPEWERNFRGAPPPDFQLTSFPSWAELGKWFADLQQPKVTVTPEIQARADELTKGKTSDDEKIRALYDFVSTRIRYIAIDLGHGRFTPHSASQVMQNRFGDCKDKQVLLSALLQAVGIRSFPALVSSRFAIDPSFPTVSFFDHVITAIPKHGNFAFADATPGVAPFGYLSPNLRDRKALVIPEAAPAALVQTSTELPFPSVEHFRADATITADGSLQAKMHLDDRNDAELALRLVYRETPQNNWERVTQTLAAGMGFGGGVSEVTATQPEDTARPFALDFEYHRTDYPYWKEKRITLPLPPLFLHPLTEEQKLLQDPLPLGPPQEITYEAVVTFPDGFKPIVSGKPIEQRTDFAEFTAVYSVDKQIMRGTFRLKSLLRELPGKERPAYVEFASLVDQATRRFVFVSPDSTGNLASATTVTSPPGPSVPSGTKEVKILAPSNSATSAETESHAVDALYQAGQRSLSNSDFEGAARIFEDTVTKDPKHKSAWNSLGWTYNKLGQFQKAEAALRKAIEINASDRSAYNNLGNSLVGQERYEEAIPQFLKQIEISPGDKWAHINLGRAYLLTKRYEKAVAELEGASTITPNDPAVPFLLARAYHGTGHDEQAVQQFQKSAALDPIPSRWNVIAYQMALDKVALDQAAHFAALAIEATEGRLKDVSLEHISTEIARLPSSLGAYWDTMGWIKFQQGDLKSAETYIASAWPLQTSGPVADHLGQIYEKQGRKADAIRMYALAIAATNAGPDTRQRLALLIGGDANVGQAVDTERPNLERVRTFHLKNPRKIQGFAEFWLLFEPGTKVSAARFITGDESMRAFDVDDSDVDGVKLVCPDSSPIKIPRRSRLACSSASGICSATVPLPLRATSQEQ